MYKNTQIKTHFDVKIILFFVMIFVVSGALLAFEMNAEANCKLNAFNIDAPSFKAGELITFSDKSEGSYEWQWDFGDGSDISYRSKTVHSFARPGTYTVKLKVNSSCTAEKTIKITTQEEVLNKALIPKIYAPKMAYQGQVIKFRDSTSHAKSWEWRFGDGTKIDAIERNPSHVYRIPGEKYASLVVNGDIKHVKHFKITVLPAKREKRDPVLERLERRSGSRGSAVDDYFSNLPEEPKRGPEIGNLTGAKFRALLLGISEDKLSYQNLLRYFCDDQPLVQLRNGKTISLKALDEAVRKRAIRVKTVTLHADKDGCVNLIALDYRYKSIF
jgi:hypothetical protein